MDIFKQSSNTREDLGMLAVMEVLEGRQRVTQRELAHQTGLNLKKVNYCLRKLLAKGYVKFQRVRQNPDKRAYLYILTPAGLRAKSQLTYRFLKFTLDFYNRMEEKLRRCLEEMDEAGLEKLVLYGASDVARILLELANGRGPEVVGIVDESYVGHEFHSVQVLKGGQLQEVSWDGVLITEIEDVEAAEVYLHRLLVPDHAVWKL